jgi:hypothetical protein
MLIFGNHAMTRFISGTIGVYVYTTDLFAVSMDSRIVKEGKTISDGYCKILPLSDAAFFFAIGKVMSDEPGLVDAYAFARQAFAERTSDPISVDHKWADLMTQGFLKAGTQAGHLATGVFVWRTASSHLLVRTMQINDIGDRIDATQATITPPWISGTGKHRELIQEFLDEQSDRVKARLEQMRQENVGKSIPDQNALKTRVIAQAAIDWLNDSAIGGEVATLVMERGKKMAVVSPTRFLS